MRSFLRILAIILPTLILSGCGALLDIKGDIVSVRSNHREKIVAIDGGFKDNIFSIKAKLEKNRIYIDISNISSEKAIIHWRESAILGIDKKPHKVYFSTLPNPLASTTFAPSLAPTILPGDSTTSGQVLNLDSEEFIPGVYSPGSVIVSGRNTYVNPGYHSPATRHNVGIIRKASKSKVEDEIDINLNKSIRLILAVEHEGRKFDYNIEFKIDHVGFQ